MQVSNATPLDGIVLHLGKVGDAHRLVEVLSLQQGRMSLLARHARASKKRFGGVLEVFATLRCHPQSARSGLSTLQAADVVNARFGIRGSLEAIMRASAICACVRRLVPEHQAAPDVYALLTRALDALDRGNVDAVAAFYPRLAAVSGILPDLSCCSTCGRSTARFSAAPVTGALVCKSCAPLGKALSDAALAGLRGAAVGDPATAAIIEETVLAWIATHTGRAWRGLVTAASIGP